MTTTDQQVRAEFIFLQVQLAMDFLKTKPTRAEVEARSAIMKQELTAGGRKEYLGDDDLFKRPGFVMGRCTTSIHSIIHNLTLGDYVERSSRAGQKVDCRSGGKGRGGSVDVPEPDAAAG